MKKAAFTLVELIVVITILAILATIGFVSFSGYLAGARDTNRIAQLKSMSDALELYRTKKDLPIPDDKVDVQAGTTTIAYQGYIGSNVLETIEYTEKGLDPKDKTYFSYYLTKNKKYFQLLSFLEEPSDDVLAGIVNTTLATDYSQRIPYVKGRKLGILLAENNTPIQEISTIQTTGFLDVINTGDTYKAIVKDELSISGTGAALGFMEHNALHGGKVYMSCQDILNEGNNDGSGMYTIYPNYVSIDVYCDMTTDGGGWTRYSKYNSSGYFINVLGSLTEDFSDIFYSYKRGGTESYAFRFKKFWTKQCEVEHGHKTSLTLGLRDYIDHIENASWGSCGRISSLGDDNDIEVEKIIEGEFVNDECLNGTLNKIDARNYSWGPITTSDGRSVGYHQHRISNTTVLFGSRGEGSGRCKGLNSGPAASEVYIFLR